MYVNPFEPAQQFLRDRHLHGWLIYDFRGSNPVFAQLLGRQFGTTRRAALFIPATGRPSLVVHAIDAPQFADVKSADHALYISWQDWFEQLALLAPPQSRVAMEYSPGGALPSASMVDAGTIETIRTFGVEIVSSEDLVQRCVAVWSESALSDHLRVSQLVAAAKDDAFEFVRQSLQNGHAITEYDVQQRIMRRFAEYGLDPDHPPIVGVNEHSGDPHFEPTAANASVIKAGDWLLIDLWARTPGEDHIFSDITWIGYCGRDVPQRHQTVYAAVVGARDACLKRAIDSWQANQSIQGWQLDDAAREVIVAAGFDKFIRHRTGHSLSPGPKVHGLGMNLDNLETHDTRTMLPGIGFTIEPGIYLPEFGVRSEINVYVDPKRGPIVSSCIQCEIERLL